jgi:hypothetical protein
MQILIKRKVDGPSVPELGTPTSVTFDSITVPLNRASTGPAALAQYELQRSLDGSTWTTIATGPSIFGNPAVQFVDGGRIALTTYYYRARALDVAGRASAYSATVSATTAATIAPSTALLFPRTATVNYTFSRYTQASSQAGMAQFDLVVINGWETGYGTVYGQIVDVCAGIKAQNPNTRIFFYLNPSGVRYDSPADRPVLRAKMNAENWWLRQSYPSGAIVRHPTYPDDMVNLTTGNTRVDSSGRTCAQWVMGDYAKGMYIDGTLSPNLPNPYLDGFFFDIQRVRAEVNGDFDENGISDSLGNTGYALAFRQGEAQGMQRFRALMPGLKCIGNTDFHAIRFEARGGTTYPDATLNQVYDGVMTEGLVGETWSPSSRAATSVAQWAQDQEDMASDITTCFNHAYRWHTLTSSNWQDARHAICAQLCVGNSAVFYMDTAFDTFSETNGSDGVLKWYDEFDAGGLGRYYLGRESDLRQKTAWSNGVWRRRFENGWVLWNPERNGVRTVNLGQTMRRLQGRAGYSDTAVNNGATVTSVTLQDRDGLVLLNG